jgi:hypothetical protein
MQNEQMHLIPHDQFGNGLYIQLLQYFVNSIYLLLS